MCGILDKAITLREETAFYQAIKGVIAKATETDKTATHISSASWTGY